MKPGEVIYPDLKGNVAIVTGRAGDFLNGTLIDMHGGRHA